MVNQSGENCRSCPDCGQTQALRHLADLGRAAGADFDLWHCPACSGHWMEVFYRTTASLTPVAPEDAETFLSLRNRPGLRGKLKAWFN